MKKIVIIAEPAGKTFAAKRKNRNRWAAMFAIANKDQRKADYCGLFTIYAARTIPRGAVIRPTSITY
jgi:hypothetical protein